MVNVYVFLICLFSENPLFKSKILTPDLTMLKKILLSLLALLCFITTTAWGAPNPSEALSALLSGFQGMSGQFKQIASIDKGKSTQTSRGEMALQRPGQFRWDVKQPNPQLLIANGRYLWIYDADLQQATRQTLDINNANSPALLLSGSIADLQHRFLITQLSESDELIGFHLKPKSDQDLFNWIELYFSKNNQLTKMLLKDHLGALNTFYFTHVKINPKLNKALFTFKAPKGVEIIYND